MVNYRVDVDELKKGMLKDGKAFVHNTGTRIRLFPFVANDKLVPKLEQDLLDFTGIAAACYREVAHYSHSINFDKEEFVQRVVAKASSPSDKSSQTNEVLADIVRNVAFDEKNRLVPFETDVYRHVDFIHKTDQLLNIARYIADIYFDEEIRGIFKNLENSDPENLLYKLFSSSLRKAAPIIPSDKPNFKSLVLIRQKFKEDFIFLAGSEHSYKFVDGFPILIKYYFFRYVTDLCLELNRFTSQGRDKPTLFFSLDWEKLQSSRAASNNGWKLFEDKLESMFVHANTLELLNYISFPQGKMLGYSEIDSIVAGLPEGEKQQLLASVEELISFYREGNKDVQWDNQATGSIATLPTSGDAMMDVIGRLWRSVDYQFSTTMKKRARRAYKQLFITFAKLNYAKTRGRNGYSLSLKHHDVLFLTAMCIGYQRKIRLKDLKVEFEQRGLHLDAISWTHLVDYYEKVNMLERKSDSGDGQYVKHLN
jgi:DNA phosphorothioation-dependent restriction protein DptG